MKQTNLFGQEFAPNQDEQKYSSKIEAPIYEPKNKQPHLLELCNKEKTHRLIKEIETSELPHDEKMFLVDAARRHNVFNYEKVADYYAHATPEMQNLMERSGLVIIDFEKAIQLGYVKLCDEIRTQYLTEYGE
jgi:DNA mismatch repair ATPase MutL